MDSREADMDVMGFVIILLAIVAIAAIGIALIAGFK